MAPLVRSSAVFFRSRRCRPNTDKLSENIDPRPVKEDLAMRVIVGFGAIVLGLAITVTGCASPPNADVEAAKASLDAAVYRPRGSVCR